MIPNKLSLYFILILCFTNCYSTNHNTANNRSNNHITTIHTNNSDVSTPAGKKDSEEGSDYLEVTISDQDGEVTNIREKPSGKVIKTLSTKGTYETNVCEVKNNWWFVCRPIHDYDNEKDIELPETGGWIHGSVLIVSTRNYGGEQLHLLEMPKNGSKIVYTFNQEKAFRPIDKKGKWVKVMSSNKKVQGWIEKSGFAAVQ